MILIGLGSSLPFCGSAPQEILAHAIRALGRAVEITDVSRFYLSPAWPDHQDPPFVNAVAAAKSGPPPVALLAVLHKIEAAFGRRRGVKNAPRTLDLDLLSYQRVVADGANGGLLLPHPGIAVRDFVLAPLCDVAPYWTSPTTGLSARAMLSALKSISAVPIP